MDLKNYLLEGLFDLTPWKRELKMFGIKESTFNKKGNTLVITADTNWYGLQMLAEKRGFEVTNSVQYQNGVLKKGILDKFNTIKLLMKDKGREEDYEIYGYKILRLGSIFVTNLKNKTDTTQEIRNEDINDLLFDIYIDMQAKTHVATNATIRKYIREDVYVIEGNKRGQDLRTQQVMFYGNGRNDEQMIKFVDTYCEKNKISNYIFRKAKEKDYEDMNWPRIVTSKD